jgi:hypothetical protein
MDEMAETELTAGAAAGQAGAQLAGGIVGQPLVEAGVVVVAHPAADDAGVVGARIVAGAEGRVLVAGMELADDDGAIDVTTNKFDKDFSADAWQEVAAPIGAGQPLGDAYPGAGGFVAGGGCFTVSNSIRYNSQR